jgi:hypothetical protein
MDKQDNRLLHNNARIHNRMEVTTPTGASVPAPTMARTTGIIPKKVDINAEAITKTTSRPVISNEAMAIRENNDGVMATRENNDGVMVTRMINAGATEAIKGNKTGVTEITKGNNAGAMAVIRAAINKEATEIARAAISKVVVTIR